MNPANILLAVQILESLVGQAANVISAIKNAQASNTDISDAQLATLADQAGTDIATLKADAAAATAAGG